MTEDQKKYLQALADKHGRLTAATVVEDAKRKDSPLHSLFEWNTRKAAEAHWMDRARELIRCVKVTVTLEVAPEQRVRMVQAPAFVRDPDLPADEQGYRTLAKVRSEPESAADVVLNELRYVEAALQRALAVAAVLDGEAELQDIADRVRRFADKVRGEQPRLQQ